MARTGRFGRQPRAASSLTTTLVAIAREFQNQRAENIMSAWEKGGTFEGRKATDEVVLAFWREKMKGVSKDDPLYDTYKNAHSQLDYTIHESKMTAQHALGKVSDAAMVSFYLNWAKKVPKNSEFYRALQRDAGQYMRKTRSNGAADARRRQEEAYQKAQSATQKQKEAAGEFVIDTLRRIAQSGNAQYGLAPAIDAPGSGSDLTDFDPNDPDLMLRLIKAIAPETTSINESTGFTVGTDEFGGSKDTIFHDDDGRAITGEVILKQLSKLDPGFKPGEPFDVNYVTGILDRQMQGLNERIARAQKTGHMSDVTSLQKSKGYVALLNREVAAYPVQKAYQELRADYDAVVADRSASPAAILRAWDEYSAGLTSLSRDERIATDDNIRARLVAEVNGDSAVPTLAESFTGLSGAGGQAKDASENVRNIEFMRQQVDAVQSGQALWTYGDLDSNGVFVPKAGGRMIGAATPEAVQAGGANVQVVTVPDPRGGVPLQMAVTAVPVYATATDPATGEPLNKSNSNPIAYAYDMPHGAGTKTTYGFQTNSGFIFSENPPWDDDLKTVASSKGGNHLEIDLTPMVEKAFGYAERDPITGEYGVKPDLTQNRDLPGGFHVRDGGTLDTKTGLPKPGQIVFDPQEAAWSTDTRAFLGLGSIDPTSDFASLTLATLLQDEEGRTILQNLDKNPQYKQTMDDDTFRFAGAQRDPKTGAWVPGTGDQSKLQRGLSQQSIASTALSFGDFVKQSGQLFTRETTGSPYSTSQAGSAEPEGFVKLATDLVKGTPFEALGKVFQSGTNNIRRPEKDDVFGVTIKPVTTMKLPNLPEVKAKTSVYGDTPPPKTSTVPTQYGSQPPGGTSAQTGSAPPSSGGSGSPNPQFYGNY